MLSKIDIKDLRFYPGAKAGLLQKTATVTLAFDGAVPNWRTLERRLRENVTRLQPAAPIWGLRTVDWPGAFAITRTDRQTFADWIVALTIAMQCWARDPVWQGRVLASTGSTIRLALPWEREFVLRDALALALRHLLLWGQPQSKPEIAVKLAKELDQWLS